MCHIGLCRKNGNYGNHKYFGKIEEVQKDTLKFFRLCHTDLCRKNRNHGGSSSCLKDTLKFFRKDVLGLSHTGYHKYLQNTTSQPEVQGTQAKHEQHYQEDLDNLGTSGRLITGTGRHLKGTEKISHHTIN